MRTRQVLALVSVCTLVVLSIVWWGARRPADPVEELALVLGERRFIEPRLTGGFAYAPCTPIDDPARLIPRSRCSEKPVDGSREWREMASTIRYLAASGGRSDAQSLRRSAISALVWPQGERFVARAVSNLQRAVQLAPRDARIRNDLAAALYVLAQERDEPALLVQALSEIGETFRLDPELPEAGFNRALILQRLFLADQAQSAWEQVAISNEGSGWRNEAQHYHGKLGLALSSASVNPHLQTVRVGSLRESRGEIRQFVASSPQTALEYGLETLLGMWGEQVEEGRYSEAEATLNVARTLGEELLAETGEPSVLAAIAAIDKADGKVRVRLAAGHRAYRDGQRLYKLQRFLEGNPFLRKAQEELEAGRSPQVAWVVLSLAGIDSLSSRYQDALVGYACSSLAARKLGSKALAGRVNWGVGLIRFRQGRFSESMKRFLDAVDEFKISKEDQSRGAVFELLAENLTAIGQRDRAWTYRYSALRSLWPHRNSIRLHNALWEAGWALIQEGEPRAGLVFLNECVVLAELARLPARLAEALLWRSKAHIALGDVQAALDDLLFARRVNQVNPDAMTRERLAADLNLAEGQVRREIDPMTALMLLSRSIRFYQERELYLDLPDAYLARFHAAVAFGQEYEARKDLDEAILLFERRRDSLDDSSLRGSANEAIQSLYDEVVLWEVAQGDMVSALNVVERARAIEGTPLPASGVLGLIQDIPSGLAILEYARVGDHLLVWLLHDGNVKSFVSRIPAGELEKVVDRFVVGVRQGVHLSKIDDLGERLYRLLIPPLVSSLPAGVRLVVIPDRGLNALPFAALINPETGRYLVEERSIVLALSASLGARSRIRSVDEEAALLVAATEFDSGVFPELRLLPAAEREVDALARIYPEARVLRGTQATVERVRTEVRGRQVLHFAGHAVFNPHSPGNSYLVLAPSHQTKGLGVLLVDEIAGWDLESLRLVVLSGCETLGPIRSRTGSVSTFARPFLDNGVDAVIGTLWPVEDDVAALIMPEFHVQYLRSGDAGGALRLAQLKLLREVGRGLSHPQVWAAFQVVQ